MVSDGAGIPIQALAFGEDVMGTTIRPRTRIDRTVISVVARIVIDGTVTIIIDAIADLFDGIRRRTGTKTGLLANTDSFTGPDVIGDCTRG